MTGPVFLVDNADSFTFNLVDALERRGHSVRTFRNTADAARLVDRAEDEGGLLVLSPGPGGPRDAGCCLDVIAQARGRVGILGVCLGHQCLLHAAGAEVVRAVRPVHGEADLLFHDATGPFAGLPTPLRVGRYHSLGVHEVPPALHVHGRVDGLAFAVSDPGAPAVGLQFHPESLLTPEGAAILDGALRFLASRSVRAGLAPASAPLPPGPSTPGAGDLRHEA